MEGLDNQGRAADNRKTVSLCTSPPAEPGALANHAALYHLLKLVGETGASTRRLVPGIQQPHRAPPIEPPAKLAMSERQPSQMHD
jgi:hypothetical protein